MEILQLIVAPLSSELILAAIVAGLFFGGIYNHRLGIPREVIYHKVVTGLGFITCIFIFRIVASAFTGIVIGNPLGWIGIALLWILFCGFIWIGDKITSRSE